MLNNDLKLRKGGQRLDLAARSSNRMSDKDTIRAGATNNTNISHLSTLYGLTGAKNGGWSTVPMRQVCARLLPGCGERLAYQRSSHPSASVLDRKGPRLRSANSPSPPRKTAQAAGMNLYGNTINRNLGAS